MHGMYLDSVLQCLLLAAVANAAESDYLLVINTILRDGLADEALQEAHMACLRCLCFIAEDVTLDKLQRCLEMHSEKIVDIIQRRPSVSGICCSACYSHRTVLTQTAGTYSQKGYTISPGCSAIVLQRLLSWRS
jgi:hypothetical protein